MGKYFVDIKDEAKIHFLKIYKSGDISSIKKLNKIIIELSNHPVIPNLLNIIYQAFGVERLIKRIG